MSPVALWCMMRNLSLAAGLLMAMAFPATAETLFEAFPDLKDRLPAEIATRTGQIELRHGTLPLPGGKATLSLTPDVYALDAEDAKYVIETLWGNPPSPETLGMIFPGKSSPFDDAWAVELTYDPMGYVSDEEAAELDPDALLATMQEETRSENELRQSNGYPTVSVIGWAVPPAYDAADHKLHWAKELKFSDTEGNTLNYNIRILGRHGVLVANFIASMALLPEVQKAAPSIMDMINFDTGARYSDFQPGVDTVAAVGIGGLIATKVAAKTGLLVVALALLKKGWFLLLLPLIWVKNLLFKKRTEDGSA